MQKATGLGGKRSWDKLFCSKSSECRRFQLYNHATSDRTYCQSLAVMLVLSTVKSHSSRTLLSELWKGMMICIFVYLIATWWHLEKPSLRLVLKYEDLFITHCAIQVYAPMGWKINVFPPKICSWSVYIKYQIYSDWLWLCHVAQLFCVRCGQINWLSLETYRITFVQVTVSVGSLYAEWGRPNRKLFAKLTQREDFRQNTILPRVLFMFSQLKLALGMV